MHAQSRKYNAKTRYGRGFTLQEIKKAGLSAKFARSVGIAVDHRRMDSSEETLQTNAQRLESYKSKLILFPRKAGKPKKGQINDSTAEKLKSAEADHQNLSKNLLGRPKRHLREKPVKITDEMKKFRPVFKLK